LLELFIIDSLSNLPVERAHIMLNTVVLHFVNGKIQKGTTDDFFPNKDLFHFCDKESGEIKPVHVNDLKAVFFVKCFEGDSVYQERTDIERVGFGKKIRVCFKDGETQVGYTQGFSPNRAGFFVFPADPESNNDRVFVINAATDTIQFI
jgi:uncharacterized protein DUF6982